MKSKIRLLVFILSIIIVFLTYKLYSSQAKKIYYVALGDSIAEGLNPYGKVEYGYPDFIKDYLEKEDNLKFYTKKFAKSGYTTNNVKSDIENGKEIEENGERINIKKALRESNLVTVTIGANNFLKGISFENLDYKLKNIKEMKREVDKVSKEVKDLLILIKKYAKGNIILTGYYNPIPRDKINKELIDEIIKYSNEKYEEICDDLDIVYVDIFDTIGQNMELLPSPLDIHPSVKGYEEIAKVLINKIKSL